MRKIDLNTVKDCGSIRACGDYVVAFGKSLWVFRKDGSFVSKSKTIRWPGKIYFLPPDKIFVEGGADYQYHYVNLATGLQLLTEKECCLASDLRLRPTIVICMICT